MDTLESFLISAGDFVRWAWAGLASGFAWFFGLLHDLLNPILSPILSILNPICTVLGRLVYAALGWLPGWISLTLISIALGLVMLVMFRLVSNQAQVSRAKDAIKANLLALKLYKDDLRVTFRTQWRLFCAVGRLQRYILTPVLVMTLPMLLLFAQMAARHQWRPLTPGEKTLVRVALDNVAKADLSRMQLDAGGGATVEVGPLPGPNDVVWRIRPERPGRYEMKVQVADQVQTKTLVVGEPLTAVSPLRPGKEWGEQLLYPVEAPLPKAGPIRKISIEYPPLSHWFYGSDWWILWLLVVSMLTGYVFRSRFGVTF